jgi:glycosyltransferase involved in cell wall biosynthesis
MGETNCPFSIVIPTYNRPGIIKKTLQCLEEQNAKFEFEVIVVDDCSAFSLTDLDLGKGRRTTWRLIRNERNLGRAATRNRGITEAAGEYILFMDDDIWATPGLLQAHYDAQIRIGGGVVVGSMPVSEAIGNDIWNDYYRKWLNGLRVEMEARRDDLPYRFFFTGNLSVPKILLQQVGLFDEGFKSYSGEDTELGYRLKQAGVLMIYESKAVGYHYNWETLDTILNKRQLMGAASLTMARKHPELSKELSFAGLLAPGRKFYQRIISRPFLYGGKMICRTFGLLSFRTLCFFCLTRLSKAYSAFGLKEALNGE